MSPKHTDKTLRQASPAGDISNTNVHDQDVSPDPYELFEGAHSISSASDAHERNSRTSDASSERLVRQNVLMVDVMGEVTTDARVHVVNVAIKEAGSTLDDAVMETTVQALHKRLRHIA